MFMMKTRVLVRIHVYTELQTYLFMEVFRILQKEASDFLSHQKSYNLVFLYRGHSRSLME